MRSTRQGLWCVPDRYRAPDCWEEKGGLHEDGSVVLRGPCGHCSEVTRITARSVAARAVFVPGLHSSARKSRRQPGRRR